MKTIPLTQGRVALVSNCDYWFLRQWKWYYAKNGKSRGGYAVRTGSRPKRQRIRMHCVVSERMRLAGRVDHRNQDELDNRRRNLRPVNLSQNQGNSHRRKNNTSGYRGVSKCGAGWFAQITKNGKNWWLGNFRRKADAARAYNKAAKKYFGRFAVLNKVP